MKWRSSHRRNRGFRLRAIGFLAGGLALGCAESGGPSPQAFASDDALEWTACDITTSSGTFKNAAECSVMTVPVRREADGGRTITLSLKRYKQTSKPRGQLWLLAGGPGAAASDLEYDADTYFDIGRDMELYFLDHRGTGRSSRLACSVEEEPTSPSGTLIRDAEWTACAQRINREWGDELSGFSTTEAARDLGEAIARARSANEPVFLYAVSYGTYLAERYLQLFPEQANGVILDSIAPPGHIDVLLEYDRQFDKTARQIFELCAANPGCSSKLASDAFTHVEALATALESGHCATLGWSRSTLRQLLGFMLSIGRLRDYMPAVVRRLERCSDNDVVSLNRFRDFVSSLDTESASFSQVLSANISLAELSARPFPTPASVRANVANLYASKDVGPAFAPAAAVWPVYMDDQYVGRFAETDVPMLMLNGNLDAETPLVSAELSGTAHHGPYQHFVAVPYSPHTTLTQSLLNDTDQTCGAELARQFLSAPTDALDLSCLAKVMPLEFDGYSGITETLFGTASAWDDVPLR